MEKKGPAGNALIFGLITGAAMIVYSIILFLANMHMNTWLPYVSFVILTAGMILGTINYRDKINGGFITYGGAFVSNFLIVIFAAILTTLYFIIYSKYINPGFIDEVMEMARQKLAEKNLSDDEIERATAMQAKFMTPLVMTILGLIGTMFWGTLLSLVVAIFVKKEDKSIQSFS